MFESRVYQGEARRDEIQSMGRHCRDCRIFTLEESSLTGLEDYGGHERNTRRSKVGFVEERLEEMRFED